MGAEPLVWLCPLPHLPTFSFPGLQSPFWGQNQGHVHEHSFSAGVLRTGNERRAYLQDGKFLGYRGIIKHCLEVRLKPGSSSLHGSRQHMSLFSLCSGEVKEVQADPLGMWDTVEHTHIKPVFSLTAPCQDVPQGCWAQGGAG